jgi:hypothetical protein
MTDFITYCHVLGCWVYVTRQITSRRIGYSEFITLALTTTQFTISQVLPSAISQLLLLFPFNPANARLQLARRLHDPHCVTPDHTLPHILLSRLFIPFRVASCYIGVPCYVTAGEWMFAERCEWWKEWGCDATRETAEFTWPTLPVAPSTSQYNCKIEVMPRGAVVV